MFAKWKENREEDKQDVCERRKVDNAKIGLFPGIENLDQGVLKSLSIGLNSCWLSASAEWEKDAWISVQFHANFCRPCIDTDTENFRKRWQVVCCEVNYQVRNWSPWRMNIFLKKYYNKSQVCCLSKNKLNEITTVNYRLARKTYHYVYLIFNLFKTTRISILED